MSNKTYQAYPNSMRGSHGPVRVGRIEDNTETLAAGFSGYVAAVTRESQGRARFYIWTITPDATLFKNNPLWMGPFETLSEYVVPL